MNNIVEYADLMQSAMNVRMRVLDMAYQCGKPAHIGGALSMVEILIALYKNVMKYNVNDMKWSMRDRFILSKGHCALGLYAVLEECGIINEEIGKTYLVNGSPLGAHPVMNIPLGIESSTGSLGQGISMAVGSALAAKIKGNAYSVYSLIGNGESNEGSVWEAAMFAAQHKLDNLTILLDNNKLQSDGESENILDGSMLKERWESFGFFVLHIDGHDMNSILTSFDKREESKPKIIIANTVKGKGVSFMENNNAWHHNRLTEESYKKAVQEIRGEKV